MNNTADHGIDSLASATSDLFATFSRADGQATVWSASERRILGRFPVAYDGMAGRLALVEAPEPAVIVARHDERETIAYNLDGSERWRRRGSGKLERLAPLGEIPGWDTTLGIAHRDRPLAIVSALDGGGVFAFAGATRAWPDDGGRGIFCVGGRILSRYNVAAQAVTCEVPLRSFAVLDLASSVKAFAFSEAGGKLRCFTHRGDPQWEFARAPGNHALAVAWSEESACWLTVQWSYEVGGPKVVTVLTEAGDVANEYILGDVVDARILGGRLVIASDGTVREAMTGRVLWSLSTVRSRG